MFFDISGSKPAHVEPIVRGCRSRIGHYIFLSSGSVYKKPLSGSLDGVETTNNSDKALAERMLLKQYSENGFPVTIFRPQAVFGPYDACWAGLIFYRLIHSLPLLVSPGRNNRMNFLYVHDLVQAFLLAMNNPNVYGSVYAVADDNITTPKEFIELCGKVSAITPTVEFIDNPSSYKKGNCVKEKRFVTVDVPWPECDQVIDNRKVKEEMGLVFVDLETALEDTLSWLLEKPAYLNYFSLRGERYILWGHPVPLGMKVFWRITDTFRVLVAKIKDTMKCIEWLRWVCRCLRRTWFIRLKSV